ncbi:MAG: 50S ribosomal protein L9 [Dehalococcoidales bacterium]|nr:50S ribosomal protein L9 [Dehalococcoidales bacterium]
MKVIFLQDVPSVAKAGEVKEVADGYGKNFLLPRKLALPANPATLKLVEAKHKRDASKQTVDMAKTAEVGQQIEGKEIVLKARVGAKDQLYGSITNADIAAELNNAGFAIDKRKIELTKPINQLGSYEVIVRLATDVTPKIKVTVIEQETK